MKTLIVSLPVILCLCYSTTAYSDTESQPCEFSYEVGFSPKGNALDLILTEIESAEKSISLAAYSFTSQPIADALISAYNKGIDISVIVNKGSINGRGAKARYLYNNNVPIKTNDKYSIMHNKFIIIDNKTVKTGSFNYSAAAVNRNAENIVIIRCVSDITNKYQQEFARLWAESIELNPLNE
ncbi:phospholipase D family nuclease [Yersinia aldovae]|uniref:phospholipase D family nuclease n=1 Tax=Yersinia aldovae TaxID=29483 RepID=UPI0011A25108|nr:phospholipase D family protein [Yersinia aldovae]